METINKTRGIRRGIARSKEDGRWTVWAYDDASKYPARPTITEVLGQCSEMHDWVNECMVIAGLDWPAFYYGPGLRFAHEPYAWIDPTTNRIQFCQHGGLDV